MSAENQHIELHDLIAKKLAGELTSQEAHQLDLLLLQEENKRIYEDISKIWNSTPAHSTIEFDAQAALSKVNNRIIETPKPEKKVSKTSYIPWLVSAAASVVIILSVLFWLPNNTNDSIATVSIQTEHFTEIQQVPIPDGTKIDINLKSTLEYPKVFGDKTREVKLSGKAFFDVAHDKKKPFIIHTDCIDIQVLGTSFYVHAEKDESETSVSVITGRVKLTSKIDDTKTVTLEKGQKGVFDKRTNTFNLTTTDENDYFWKTKTLVFRNTTIEKVVTSINQNYNTTLEVRGKLAKQAIETTFENNSPEEIIQILQVLSECTVRKEGQKTILE